MNNPLNGTDPSGLTMIPPNPDGDPMAEFYDLIDWERMAWCSDDVGSQVEQCKSRVESRAARVKWNLVKMGVMNQTMITALCGAMGLAGNPGMALICKVSTTTVNGWVLAYKLKAIMDWKQKGLDYCDDMGSWCNGTRTNRPDWSNYGGGDSTRPWAKESSHNTVRFIDGTSVSIQSSLE
jgi:hypothetical protein